MAFIYVAAGLCVFTLAVHAGVGQQRVVAPLSRAEFDPFARATLLVVWHMVTWTLGFSCAGLLLGALGDPAYVRGVGVLCAGYALIFALVAQRVFGAAIRLPQWMLLGGVSVFALAGSVGSAAACNLTLAGLLFVVALVHALWALGVTWPARDQQSLALAVMGRKTGASPLACWAVALVLLVFAALLLLPAPRALRMAVAALFVVRGTLGFVEPLLRREIVGTPYLIYSRYMYTPLSLAVGVAIAGTA